MHIDPFLWLVLLRCYWTNTSCPTPTTTTTTTASTVVAPTTTSTVVAPTATVLIQAPNNNLPTTSTAPKLTSYVIFHATFDHGSDEFTYQQDGFRDSERSSYANAFTETTMEYRNVIGVQLSWINNDRLNHLSGGWTRIFTLSDPRNVAISITFQLEQSAYYESHEISQALCSIDGILLSNSTDVDYLAQIRGDGDSGANIVDGFNTATIYTSLSAGLHTIQIGGYVSSRSNRNEITWIRFDEVTMTALEGTVE